MTTLYITEQGAYLNVKNQQLQISIQGDLRLKVPVNFVSSIVLFGCCHLSHAAINLALERHIPITFVSQQGKYRGQLETAMYPKVEYVTRQVDAARNEDFIRQQAEAIVWAKVHNSQNLLMRLSTVRSLILRW